MYVPDHFSEQRPQELQRIMREHPLGVLVTHGASGPDADHLPFEFDAGRGPLGTLTAHVARANPVWQRGTATGPAPAPVLVIFRGVEAYVSPNWYPSKHEFHRQVPTWNYEVVHAHGRLIVRDDERFVRGLVARLTRVHESTEPRPWRMSDSAPAFIDAMLQNIVGIEIEIASLVGKSKLSQNKETRDRLGAAHALSARDEHELAALMRPA